MSISQDDLRSLIKQAVHEELSLKQEKELMNFTETKEFLGVSVSCLNAWKRSGKIPFKRMGKRIFFHKREIMEALKESNYLKLKQLEGRV